MPDNIDIATKVKDPEFLVAALADLADLKFGSFAKDLSKLLKKEGGNSPGNT